MHIILAAYISRLPHIFRSAQPISSAQPIQHTRSKSVYSVHINIRMSSQIKLENRHRQIVGQQSTKG